jgi:hypothetical protein
MGEAGGKDAHSVIEQVEVTPENAKRRNMLHLPAKNRQKRASMHRFVAKP